MAKTQTASTKAIKGPRVVAPGTLSGPKGRKLVETPAEVDTKVTEDQREGERRQATANAVMQFTSGQLTTPAAHAPQLTAEQKKLAEYNEKVAQLAKEMGVEVPAAKVTTPRAGKVVQNDITRPATESLCGLIWSTADDISANQAGNPATIAQLKANDKLKTVNDHTVKTQYARWRKFNGVKGRLQVIKVAAAPAGSGVVMTHDGNP